MGTVLGGAGAAPVGVNVALVLNDERQ